jgi:hypothetical protein
MLDHSEMGSINVDRHLRTVHAHRRLLAAGLSNSRPALPFNQGSKSLSLSWTVPIPRPARTSAAGRSASMISLRKIIALAKRTQCAPGSAAPKGVQRSRSSRLKPTPLAARVFSKQAFESGRGRVHRRERGGRPPKLAIRRICGDGSNAAAARAADFGTSA